MFAVAHGLQRAGWIVTRQASPEAIGMHAALFHRHAVDRYRYLTDPADAVEEVRAGRITRSGEAAAYN